MAWATTLEVVDDAVPSFKLQGASVFDDYGNGGYTDTNGQLIYIVDDSFNQYFVKIGHPGATVHAAFGYQQKNYILNKSNASTVQQVRLQPAPDPGTGTGNGVKCFIVTATTGSSESAEVVRLRQLRDRVITVSQLAGELIDAIYHDYCQFSPSIAAELEQDMVARKATLWVIVRPLFAWYTLAGVLAFEQDNSKAVKQAIQDVLSTCPQYLGGSSILTLLETICAGETLPPNTHPLLLDFVPRIQEASSLQFASWAILDPLVRVWRSATDHLDVVDEVAQWLATAPLEVFTPPSNPQMLDREFGVLAGFFDFRPKARLQLGERLTAAWPDALNPLERAGFVSQIITK